jgi:hypothetical protein
VRGVSVRPSPGGQFSTVDNMPRGPTPKTQSRSTYSARSARRTEGIHRGLEVPTGTRVTGPLDASSREWGILLRVPNTLEVMPFGFSSNRSSYRPRPLTSREVVDFRGGDTGWKSP